MSWHFSRVLEEDFSLASSSVGVPYAPSSLTPTALDGSSKGSAKITCRRFRFGTMYVPSMDARGEALLTWFRGVFPARTSRVPARVKGLQASGAGSGSILHVSSGRLRRPGLSSKTPRIYALAALTSSSGTLPPSGMMRAGEYWAQPMSARLTSADECGSLPTPTTAGNEMSPCMERWPAHSRLAALRGRVLPTPAAILYGHNKGGAQGRKGKERPSVDVLTGGPWISFREWMMGWPIGWTGLEPLGTARFLEWLRWHGTS